jgi:hypothetical protein
VDNFGLGSSDLSDFFSTISSGKKVIKEQKESLVGESFERLFWSQLTEDKVEKTLSKKAKKKKINPPIIQEELIKEDIIAEKKEDKKEKNDFTEPNYTESPSSKNKDPLTPLNQEFLTVKDFNQHYKLFLSRIQQQLSTLGGGGETRLRYLDDVVGVATNSGAYDGKYLQWNSTANRAEFTDPSDVGGTTIVNISGITTYYQALNIDDYIGVSASNPVTIILPTSPVSGKKIIVKDEGNQITTYNITVTVGAGVSIENNTSVIMSINHQSLTYFYNGSNWFLI